MQQNNLVLCKGCLHCLYFFVNKWEMDDESVERFPSVCRHQPDVSGLLQTKVFVLWSLNFSSEQMSLLVETLPVLKENDSSQYRHVSVMYVFLPGLQKGRLHKHLAIHFRLQSQIPDISHPTLFKRRRVKQVERIILASACGIQDLLSFSFSNRSRCFSPFP